MSALREVLARFGIEVDSEKLDKADGKISGLASTLKEVGGLFAAGALAMAVRGFAHEMLAVGEVINKTSAKLGIGADELQRWQFAAKMSDVEAEELAAGFRFLQKNAYEAATAGGDAAATFTKLGVKVKDSGGHVRNSSDMMRDLVVAFSGIKNPAERTALAMQVFGKSGATLIPLLAQDKDGLEDLNRAFDELGGGVSGESLEAIDKLEKATKEFDFALLSLKGRIALHVVPWVREMTHRWTVLTTWFGGITDGTKVFNAALLVLQGTMAYLTARAGIMAAKLLAPYAPMIAMLAILFLLLEDLLTLFDGGESAIGKFIDRLFGLGTAAGIVKGLKELWSDLVGVIQGSPGAVDKFVSDFLRHTKKIADFFEKDIPEAAAFAWRDLKVWASNLTDEFTQWASDWAKAMGKSIKDFFGIKSPSKFMQDVGVNLDMGLVQGIAEGETKIKAQAGETFGGAFPAVVRVPSLDGGRVPSTGPRTVDQRNTIAVTIQGSGATANDVRTGLGLAFADEREGLLNALEAVAEGG